MRILHRTGRYRHVIEIGRAFFSGRVPQPSVTVARIATVVAQSMLALRQPAAARGVYEEILELNNRLRSAEGVADTLLGLANSQLLDCHWDEADALYQEARFRYEELGQSDKALACMVNLGVLRGRRGDLTGGRSILLQAIARSSQLGDVRRVGSIELGLGFIEMRLGRPRAALSYFLSVLRRARRARAPRSRGLAFEFLGELYLNQGRPDRARLCLRVGRKIALEIAPEGDLLFEIRRREAEAAMIQGNPTAARFLALESQGMARGFGDPCEIAAADRILAEAEALQGRTETALQIIRSAVDTLDRLGETYERARLELLRIRLEARYRGLLPARVRERLTEATRAFLEFPDSPIRQEADRIAEESERGELLPAPLGASRSRAGRALVIRAVPVTGSAVAEAAIRETVSVQTEDRCDLRAEQAVRALEENGWNISAAARGLGVTRATLTRFLRKHRISRPLNEV